MEYRQLGRSGLRVSVIGLGGNTFGRYADEQRTAAIISRAIEVGINLVDTADVYGVGASEELVGKALAGRRDQMLIATKVGMQMGEGANERGSSRKRVIEGCHASLRRLNTHNNDLYKNPPFDSETPLAGRLGALADLGRAGQGGAPALLEL